MDDSHLMSLEEYEPEHLHLSYGGVSSYVGQYSIYPDVTIKTRHGIVCGRNCLLVAHRDGACVLIGSEGTVVSTWTRKGE